MKQGRFLGGLLLAGIATVVEARPAEKEIAAYFVECAKQTVLNPTDDRSELDPMRSSPYFDPRFGSEYIDEAIDTILEVRRNLQNSLTPEDDYDIDLDEYRYQLHRDILADPQTITDLKSCVTFKTLSHE